MAKITRKQAAWLAGGVLTGAGAGVAARKVYNKRHPVETRIYLGGKRGARVIPAGQVESFLQKEAVPQLGGYSVERVSGVWGKTHEPTRILHYIGPPADIGKTEHIADEYRKKFGQEAVLVTRGRVRSKFITGNHR